MLMTWKNYKTTTAKGGYKKKFIYNLLLTFEYQFVKKTEVNSNLFFSSNVKNLQSNENKIEVVIIASPRMKVKQR